MSHIHEKIDFAVEVFIVYKNKVLLRQHDKFNMWLGVGGHIELDEDPIQAALRECQEEVGLEVKIIPGPMAFPKATDKELAVPQFMNRHDIRAGHEHVILVYFATVDTDNIQEPAGVEKSQGLKWLTQVELNDPDNGIMENVCHYAKAALLAAAAGSSKV